MLFDSQLWLSGARRGRVGFTRFTSSCFCFPLCQSQSWQGASWILVGVCFLYKAVASLGIWLGIVTLLISFELIGLWFVLGFPRDSLLLNLEWTLCRHLMLVCFVVHVLDFGGFCSFLYFVMKSL